MATASLAQPTSPETNRRRVHFCSDTSGRERSCSSLGSGPLSRYCQTPMTPAWLTPAQAARAHSAYGAACCSSPSSDGTPISGVALPWEFMLEDTSVYAAAPPWRVASSPPEVREAAHVIQREVAALILQTWVRRRRSARAEQLQLRQVARQLWSSDCAVRPLAIFRDTPDWTIAVDPHRRRRTQSLENLKAAALDTRPKERPPHASSSSASHSSSTRRPLASLRQDNGQRPQPRTYRQLRNLKRI